MSATVKQTSLSEARKMTESVERKAGELGIRVAVAVVDSGANTVLF